MLLPIITNMAVLDDFTKTIIKVIAYIAPYFLIPLTFKFGLGVFGNLAGMVNDRSRGFFDRQRKFREGSKANAKQAAREGRRFASGNSTNRMGMLNRGIANTLNAPGAISSTGSLLRPGSWAGAARSVATSNNVAAIERTMKENQLYQSWMHDDELNRAATESNNESELRKTLGDRGYQGARLETAVAQVEGVRRSMNSDSFKAMTALQAIAGGTSYVDKYDSDGNLVSSDRKEAWANVAKAAGNDDSMAAYLVAKGRNAAMSAGRVDEGGAGFGATFGAVTKMRDELLQTGTISDATKQAQNDAIMINAYESQGGATIVHSSMKPESVKAMAGPAYNSVASASTKDNEREFIQRMASISATQDGLAGSSPEKASIWADSVMGKKVDVSKFSPEVHAALKLGGPIAEGTEMTIQQLNERLRTNPIYNEMRREYGSASQEALTRPPQDPNQGAGSLPNTP